MLDQVDPFGRVVVCHLARRGATLHAHRIALEHCGAECTVAGC